MNRAIASAIPKELYNNLLEATLSSNSESQIYCSPLYSGVAHYFPHFLTETDL